MRWLLVGVASLGAASAFAQARRVAAVAVTPDAEAGAQALLELLKADARLERVDPSTRLWSDADAREAKSVEAARLVGEAREALDNLRVAQAVSTAEKAIKFYESSNLSTGVRGLLDAYALHALASLAKGDKASFSNDVQRLLAASPDYAWDEGRLTPAARAALAPLEKKMRAAAATPLSITSSPDGARVYVDGVFAGVTPVTVPDSRPGSHYVSVLSPGYELAQDRVFSGAGAPPAFALKLAPGGGPLLAQLADARAGIERGEVGRPGAALARTLDASEVLLASVRAAGDKREAVVTRVMADGTVVGNASAPLGGGAAAWQALAKDVLERSVPEARREETPAAPTEVVVEDKGSRRRSLGWVSAAVAAASLGGGIALGLASKSRAEDANQTPQVDESTYERDAKQARLEAGFADGLFILATATAVTSVILLVSGYSAEDAGAESSVSPAWAPLPGGGVAVGVRGRF